MLSLLWRVGRAPRVLRKRALQRYYDSELRRPIEPNLAAFAAYWYRGYSCNPKAVYEKLRELAPEVRGVWIVDREHEGEMPAGVDYVVAGTKDYYRLLARARYLVNNVNFPNDVVKRDGTVHVQTHHGTPLKKMGLDLRDAHFAGKQGHMDFDKLLRRCRRWDYSVTANPFSTEMWKTAYPVDCVTLEVGYPRNDALVNASAEDVAAIRAALRLEPGRKAILYAPTHREYADTYVATVDPARFARRLGRGFVILNRAHYFYRDEVSPAGEGVLDVSSHPSIEELCLASDALVTDYSALMFDYAVLDRPIVIHAPDWEEYEQLRGTYFDLLAEPPGVVTRTEDDLVAAFRSGIYAGAEAARLRASFRERFCSLEDGGAAERVVRAVWLAGGDDNGEPAPARPARARIGA
jgi:CDP-glycerol glycerophosphotransferase